MLSISLLSDVRWYDAVEVVKILDYFQLCRRKIGDTFGLVVHIGDEWQFVFKANFYAENFCNLCKSKILSSVVSSDSNCPDIMYLFSYIF